MIPPTTNELGKAAVDKLDEILAMRDWVISDDVDKYLSERIRSEVFPLVALVTVLETNRTFVETAMRVVDEVAIAAKDFMPTAVWEQPELPAELVFQPKAEA